jgi:hypothetical protein
VPAAVSEGWRRFLAGEVEGARPIFERVKKAVLKDDDHALATGISGLASWVDGKRAVAYRTSHQLVVIDTSTSALRGIALLELGAEVEPVPGTSLFVATADKRRLLYDANGAALVADLPYSAHAVASDGKTIAFAAHREPTEADLVALYDVAARRELWRVVVPRPLDVIRDVGGVYGVELADSGRVVVANGPLVFGGVAAFEASTGKLIVTVAPLAYGPPGFSADGKLVAHIDPAGRPNVRVGERDTGRTVGTTSTCSMPDAVDLDPSGQRLAIGRKNGFCVVDVPSMRTVAKLVLPEQAPPAETEWPVVLPTMVDAGHLFVARRDGLGVLFAVPSLKRLWTSKYAYTTTREGGAFVIVDFAAGRMGRALTLRPDGTLAGRDLDGDERQRYQQMAGARAEWRITSSFERPVSFVACHVGDWVLPKDVCPEPPR